MPRHARTILSGVPLHVRQRAVDRQACFHSPRDFRKFQTLLDEAAERYACAIHAFVLMTNHVHLLLTPEEARQASRFMKHLAQKYAQYFNRKYRRCGPLWESRFRSSLVDSEGYLLECYRYIELNPVRAGMVASASQYPWSSFRVNGLGARSSFIRPHEVFERLAADAKLRRQRYAGLVAEGLTDSQLAAMRAAIAANAAFGSEEFIRNSTSACGRPTQARPRGRPRAAVPLHGKKSTSP